VLTLVVIPLLYFAAYQGAKPGRGAKQDDVAVEPAGVAP